MKFQDMAISVTKFTLAVLVSQGVQIVLNMPGKSGNQHTPALGEEISF